MTQFADQAPVSPTPEPSAPAPSVEPSTFQPAPPETFTIPRHVVPQQYGNDWSRAFRDAKEYGPLKEQYDPFADLISGLKEQGINSAEDYFTMMQASEPVSAEPPRPDPQYLTAAQLSQVLDEREQAAQQRTLEQQQARAQMEAFEAQDARMAKLLDEGGYKASPSEVDMGLGIPPTLLDVKRMMMEGAVREYIYDIQRRIGQSGAATQDVVDAAWNLAQMAMTSSGDAAVVQASTQQQGQAPAGLGKGAGGRAADTRKFSELTLEEKMKRAGPMAAQNNPGLF